MSIIAVDIVLLPDENTTQKAVDINSELVSKFGNEIVLSKDNCLPHISLAMGCIDETETPCITDKLINIYGVTQTQFEPTQIKIDSLAICHLGNHCTCRKILAKISCH